jgi:hypothetical protein
MIMTTGQWFVGYYGTWMKFTYDESVVGKVSLTDSYFLQDNYIDQW